MGRHRKRKMQLVHWFTKKWVPEVCLCLEGKLTPLLIELHSSSQQLWIDKQTDYLPKTGTISDQSKFQHIGGGATEALS